MDSQPAIPRYQGIDPHYGAKFGSCSHNLSLIFIMNGSVGERHISERVESSYVVVDDYTESVLIYSLSMVHASLLTDAESGVG